MQIRIKDALVDELSTLDCVKRHLVAVDSDGNPIEKVFTALEKQEAIKNFVHDELKSRLLQKRREDKITAIPPEADVVIE